MENDLPVCSQPPDCPWPAPSIRPRQTSEDSYRESGVFFVSAIAWLAYSRVVGIREGVSTTMYELRNKRYSQVSAVLLRFLISSLELGFEGRRYTSVVMWTMVCDQDVVLGAW